MALRAITAKGVAIGAIAATVVAALLLRIPASPPDRGSPIAARPLVVGLVYTSRVPLPKTGAEPARRVERSVTPGVVPSRTLALSGLSRPLPADERRPGPLASRAITLVVDPPQAVGGQVTPVEAAPRGALTRAMDTTAGAFRVAGNSVAGVFRKVF